MTTGLTYSTYVSQMATMAVVDANDPNFQVVLPQMITYAENRICRDIDFLFTSTALLGYSLTPGSRTLTIPQGTLVVSEQINVLTPFNQANPDFATRNPCIPVTKEFLDLVYGSTATAGVPQYYCAFNDNLFYFGPYPDNNYFVEIVGTFRPASLSASNPSTFISTYLPDLMIMASMIYVSAYQRNFGRLNDDPQMAVTYESQYQSLLKGALIEEVRKKYESSAWSSMSPSPVATPTRG